MRLGFGGAPGRMPNSYIKNSCLRFIHGRYSLMWRIGNHFADLGVFDSTLSCDALQRTH